jgi:dTDP-4-dehydrorhamnose 3,5-epimerase
LRFHDTPIHGARLIDLEPRGDDRGFFARLYCEEEFVEAGLVPAFVQINDSLSGTEGTLRGLHYQLPPHAETKVVRCVRGSLWDVILDIRPDSPTFGSWFGATLSADDRRMMYVPEGVAHGFLTLAPDTEAVYLVSTAYAPDAERGIRWDDPRFGIQWPVQPRELSDKDATWPDFDPDFHAVGRFREMAGVAS